MHSLEITAHELQALMKLKADYCILDVRNAEELEKASFPNALHIPLSEVTKNVAKVPQNKIVITLCHHGVRSLNACYLLRQKGFDKVVSLKGGIEGWSREIDPSIPLY